MCIEMTGIESEEVNYMCDFGFQVYNNVWRPMIGENKYYFFVGMLDQIINLLV